MRRRLRACFPGVTFKMRTDRYAGGASIRVAWIDGPAVQAVDEACAHFQRSWYDSMTETKHFHDDVLMLTPEGGYELLSPGVDYVNTHRDLGDAFLAVLSGYASELVRTQAGETFDLELVVDVHEIVEQRIWQADRVELIDPPATVYTDQITKQAAHLAGTTSWASLARLLGMRDK